MDPTEYSSHADQLEYCSKEFYSSGLQAYKAGPHSPTGSVTSSMCTDFSAPSPAGTCDTLESLEDEHSSLLDELVKMANDNDMDLVASENKGEDKKFGTVISNISLAVEKPETFSKNQFGVQQEHEKPRVSRRCNLHTLPEEMTKARRREQNRLAAQRCRIRNRYRKVGVYGDIMQDELILNKMIEKLNQERQKLQELLKAHQKLCPLDCSGPSTTILPPMLRHSKAPEFKASVIPTFQLLLNKMGQGKKIADYLFSRNSITCEEKNTVFCKGETELIRELLNIMCGKSSAHFWVFTDAIEETEQDFLLDYMLGPDILKLKAKSIGLNRDEEEDLYGKLEKDAQNHIANKPVDCSLIRKLDELGIKLLAIYRGCLIYILKIPSQAALEKLKAMQESGELDILVSGKLLDDDSQIMLDRPLTVSIKEGSYERVKQNLEVMDGIAYDGYDVTWRNHEEDVLRCMQPSPLVEYLWQHNVIRGKDREAVMCYKTKEEQNKALTELIIGGGPWAFSQFILALDRFRQEHIANLFCKASMKSDDLPMSETNRRILKDNHSDLIEKLCLSTLLIYLEAESVLTPFDIQRIKAVKPEYEKNITFLHIMQEKPDKCFQLLGKCLCLDMQHHLAKTLGLYRRENTASSLTTCGKTAEPDTKEQSDVTQSSSNACIVVEDSPPKEKLQIGHIRQRKVILPLKQKRNVEDDELPQNKKAKLEDSEGEDMFPNLGATTLNHDGSSTLSKLRLLIPVKYSTEQLNTSYFSPLNTTLGKEAQNAFPALSQVLNEQKEHIDVDDAEASKLFEATLKMFDESTQQENPDHSSHGYQQHKKRLLDASEGQESKMLHNVMPSSSTITKKKLGSIGKKRANFKYQEVFRNT